MKSFKKFLFEKPFTEAPIRVLPSSIPDKLYHATDTADNVPSILENGLKASSEQNVHGYDKQKAGVIYLAAKPLNNEDNIKEFHVNFEIDTTDPAFDKEKVFLDENRYSNEEWGPVKDITLILQNHGNVYFEYVADLIPPNLITLYEDPEE